MTDLIRILIAPTIWLVSFGAIYGLQGLSCAGGAPAVQPVEPDLWHHMPMIVWVTAMLAQGALIAGLRNTSFASNSAFVQQLSSLVCWTALVATLWTFFPAAILSTCG